MSRSLTESASLKAAASASLRPPTATAPTAADLRVAEVTPPRPAWPHRWLRRAEAAVGIHVRRPHLLYVQAGSVWHWNAALDDARFSGRERRASRRPERHDSVAAWCQAHPGTDVRLLLASRLTHHVLVQDRSLPLFERADVERYARHQLVHYHGNAAEQWPLAVWLQGHQRGASALHGLDLAALKAQAQQSDVCLRGIEPAWAQALRLAQREAPELLQAARTAMAWIEGTHLCWLVLERGALVSLQQRMLAAPTLAALEALIGELRDEEDAALSVHVLGHGIDAETVRGCTLLGAMHATDYPATGWLLG